MQTFQMNREEVVIAWQRDRKRLRRVVDAAKSLKFRWQNAERWVTWNRGRWYHKRRWSAAWKAAAKLEHEMRKTEMADKTYIAYRLNEKLQIELDKLQAERDEERVTRRTWEEICKMKHDLLEETEAERDELQRRLEEATRIVESVTSVDDVGAQRLAKELAAALAGGEEE